MNDLQFSHDGKWIAYVTYPDRMLWRSRTDGSERLQLTTPPMRAFLPIGRRTISEFSSTRS